VRSRCRPACAASTSLATACALPLGGWLVFAFNAPLALIASASLLALGAALATARQGALFDRARCDGPGALLADRRRRVALARRIARRADADAFLLVISVPVTMLFGALPFLLADKLPAGLPAWLKPTDVLFLTHYKALEAGDRGRDRAAVDALRHRAEPHEHGRDVCLVRLPRRVAAADARRVCIGGRLRGARARRLVLAAAGVGAPIARSARAGRQPPARRRRSRRLDSLAYVAGALIVQTTGFASGTLGVLAVIAALLFVGLLYGARTRVAAPPAAAQPALPPLAEKLAIYRRFLSDQRAYIETRLSDAVPRLGLVKRATPPPTFTTSLAVSPGRPPSSRSAAA
jgi:hypothetical protein